MGLDRSKEVFVFSPSDLLPNKSNLKMPKKGSGRGKMPADLLAKYEEAFDAIDSDGEGSISKAELTFILGDGIPEEAIDACLAKFDTDKDGSMEKEEYYGRCFHLVIFQLPTVPGYPLF